MRNKKQRMIIDIAEVTIDIDRYQKQLEEAQTASDDQNVIARLTWHVESLQELKTNLVREYNGGEQPKRT